MGSKIPESGPQLVSETKSTSSDLVNVSSGAELNETAAGLIAASRPIRLMVIAGGVAAGKTTLLTSLYELFLSSPVSGCLFAGSNVLPAFERRCHPSRIASGGDHPDTLRTPQGNPLYLHLALCAATPPRTRLDLLFTDISGEDFDNARDSITECQKLTFLRRADHLTVLLDGEKVAGGEKHRVAEQDVTMLLQSLLDSRVLGTSCFVKVVLSKYDWIEAAPNREECLQFWTEVKARLKRKFGDRIASLGFAETAARPTRCTALGFGYGLPELLAEWVARSARARKMELIPKPASNRRESEAFAARHFRQNLDQ